MHRLAAAITAIQVLVHSLLGCCSHTLAPVGEHPASGVSQVANADGCDGRLTDCLFVEMVEFLPACNQIHLDQGDSHGDGPSDSPLLCRHGVCQWLKPELPLTTSFIDLVHQPLAWLCPAQTVEVQWRGFPLVPDIASRHPSDLSVRRHLAVGILLI